MNKNKIILTSYSALSFSILIALILLKSPLFLLIGVLLLLVFILNKFIKPHLHFNLKNDEAESFKAKYKEEPDSNRIFDRDSRTFNSKEEYIRSINDNLVNHLLVLGLSSKPNSKRDLKKAYLKRMKEYHPDVSGIDSTYAAKINESYNLLKKHIN